ncbi:MAG: hypothetical protein IAI50_16110 [Candidatus Eremiobacteraeota bacterium]|nr:hypothetical protein [Candidatus Eremiobacteraeota bacterium]
MTDARNEADMADGVPAQFTEITTLAGLLIGSVGVISFVVKVFQDKNKFRRDQATSAHALIKDIFETKSSMDALNMLDYDSHYYSGKSGSVEIDRGALKLALRTSNLEVITEVELFVRDAFDSLLLKLEATMSLLDVRYIRWEDVEALLGYYVFLVRNDDELFKQLTQYATAYGYPRAASIFQDANSYQTRYFPGAVRKP